MGIIPLTVEALTASALHLATRGEHGSRAAEFQSR